MEPQVLSITNLKGVGQVELQLKPDKSAYVFIGPNGIGKTKILEALFQLLFFHSSPVLNNVGKMNVVRTPDFVAERISFAKLEFTANTGLLRDFLATLKSRTEKPILYLGSQRRGFFEASKSYKVARLGSFEERRVEYLKDIFDAFNSNLHTLNMATDVEEWFSLRAMSANRYQKKSDERSVEIETVLRLIHKLEPDFDPDFMELTGSNEILIKVAGQKRRLNELSSGYSSIMKIFQAIVAGYAALTNETELTRVPGIVLIDEVESHLHMKWQTKIIPLLKNLFPNTTFYISTHSPIVLSQLHEGEAYQLQREADGTVRAKNIGAPGKAAFVDLLKDAFDIDLNELKKERMSGSNQQEAKAALLQLLDEAAKD